MTYPWNQDPITDEPDVDYSLSRRSWRLVEDVLVQMPDGEWLGIPANFEWDLASIPRCLWWRIAPNELSLMAPLIHDWLYVHDGWVTEDRRYSRKEADAFFHAFMRRQGVGRFRAWEAWKAVRLFGRRFWTP